jgi:hypothetical protein
MQTDDYRPLFKGHVKMRSTLRGLIFDDHNLVVDASVELVVQALLGRDSIDSILFGFSGGVVVTPGLRQVYNPVYRAPVGISSSVPPYISKDDIGLKSVVTWTGVYSNTSPSSVSYDMLGLVSQNDRMFAAVSFPTVSIAPNESVAVEWTIITRGR